MEPCIRLSFALSETIDNYIKAKNFNTNPLIVKDGIAVGLLNEFDKEFLNTTYVWTGNISGVYKNSDYFIDLYGEKAKDGILFYRTKDYIKEGNPKWIYLLNGIETEFKKIKKLNRKNKTRIAYAITDVYINNEEKINIINFQVLN